MRVESFSGGKNLSDNRPSSPTQGREREAPLSVRLFLEAICALNFGDLVKAPLARFAG